MLGVRRKNNWKRHRCVSPEDMDDKEQEDDDDLRCRTGVHTSFRVLYPEKKRRCNFFGRGCLERTLRNQSFAVWALQQYKIVYNINFSFDSDHHFEFTNFKFKSQEYVLLIFKYFYL
jgi:hypothetical protein